MKAHQLLINFMVLLTLLLIPKTSEAHNPFDQTLTKTPAYRCPPCGCRSDHLVFGKPGKCPSCSMHVVPVCTGLKAEIDAKVGHAFRDGSLGVFYPKLIYPIFVFGIILSVLLILPRKRGKILNPYLGGILLVLSLFGFKNQLYGVEGSITCDFQAIFTPISFITALGPLAYFYVLSTLGTRSSLRKADLIHFVPCLVFAALYLLLLLMPESTQRAWMHSPFEASFSHWEQAIATLGLATYSLLAWQEFQLWKRTNSNGLVIRRWIPKFLALTGSLSIVWALVIFINFWLYDLQVTTLTYNPIWLIFGVVLIWIVGEVALNPKFFLDSKLVWSRSSPDDSGYSDALDVIMREQRLFTDPQLSLEKLATGLEINPRQLSSVLNNEVGKNFYDYVNRYRIEEVKVLLKDPKHQHLTIEAIANLAGFKSKSSFNTAFKKHTNMTPREYLRNEDS